MRIAVLGALLASAALAGPAVAADPPGLQWQGFTIQFPDTAGAPGAKATVYYNPVIHDDGKGGVVKVRFPGETKTVDFNYAVSSPLFDLKRVEHSSVFEKKPLNLTLYVEDSKDKKTRRFVVRDNTPDAFQTLLNATRDKLDVKPLVELAGDPRITDPASVVVRDAGQAPADGAADHPKAPPPSSSDPVDDALAKLCAGQCKKTEPFFFSQALHDAESMPNDNPDKKRLLAIKDLLIKEAAAGSTSQEDPQSINRLRSDAYVQKKMADQVTNPDQAVTDKMLAAHLSQDDLLGDFCDTVGPRMGALRTNKAFAQAKEMVDGGGDGGQWDGAQYDSAQKICADRRAKAGTTDPRSVDTSDNGSHGGGGTRPSLTGDGVFHVPEAKGTPPAEPTNPHKDLIFGGKMGFVTGLLGFIFGGPAGAILFGLAGLGAGYYISKYNG